MDEFLNMLSDAVASQNWFLVVGIAVVLVLGVVKTVLKAIGRPFPILDSILELAKGALKFIPRKAPPAPAPGEAEGVASVVPVVEEKKGPNP